MSKPKRITPGDGDPRHGTRNGYVNLRCRGADCTVAKRDSDRARGLAAQHRGRVGDDLLVTCWCEGEMLFVPRVAVRSGLTGSCGSDGCVPQRLAS